MTDIKKDELIHKINFISSNVENLNLEEKKDILKIILNSNIDEEKIHEKGNGTLIKFKNIPHDTLNEIYLYISKKQKEKVDKLATFTIDN